MKYVTIDLEMNPLAKEYKADALGNHRLQKSNVKQLPVGRKSKSIMVRFK